MDINEQQRVSPIDSQDSQDKGQPANIVSSQAQTRRQRVSGWFTIACAGFALISDGYQNNLMTMTNVVLGIEYTEQYTSTVSTRVSNALLVGAILGQLVIGLVCDRFGRKFALIATTLLLIFGTGFGAGAQGATIETMFWWLTVARGIAGFGLGGEYPASSTSAAEAANETTLKNRGPVFILVTNLVLSLGNPINSVVFLIVLSAAGQNHL